MKVTFTGHSGFYAVLPEAALLFDFYTGKLPEPVPGKPLFVFVSHAHADHFSGEIFRLAESGASVTFILSDDIPEGRIPPDLLRQTVFMGPDETLSVPLPKGAELVVRTFRSTDEGVAFLLDIGGKRIYHAGDLNDWHWDDIDIPWNEEQRTGYYDALSKIARVVQEDGHVPDCAFVPVDSRLGPFYYMGLREFMEEVGADLIFPMHLFGDPGIIQKMKAHPAAKEYGDRILGTGTPGESFDL